MSFGFGFSLTAIAQTIKNLFNPASLFANNAPGVWYDLSLTDGTLFQDAAGTIPVAAGEQPVGLVLDKSKGLVLGPELVTNGTFDTDTAWTKGTGWTISGGSANVSSAGAAYLDQPNILTAGKTYRITFTVSNFVSGNITLSGTYFSPGFQVNTNGTFTVLLSANSTLFRIGSTNAASYSLDNISVRELPGNHAYQATSANRPVLSARYNLLTKTEQFDNAAWTKQAGTTVSSTKVAAPDGTLTAFSVTGNGTSGVYQAISSSVSIGQSTRSVYLRSPSGAVSVSIKDPVETKGSATCNLTTSWQRFTLTETTTPTAGFVAGIWISNIPVAGIEIAWPDVRSTNDGVGLPPYQRVNTATDYDTVGFPLYLRFNGSTQFLQTNSIDFSSTDKVLVAAGVRKLSDAAPGIIVEFSANVDVNSGVFQMTAPRNASVNEPNFYSKGTSLSGPLAAGNTLPAPITNTLTGLGDISGDLTTLRINGTQVASNTADQGTGNLGQHPLYIGARAGTSVFFNGRLYSLIIAGIKPTDAQILGVETYINRLTRAF